MGGKKPGKSVNVNCERPLMGLTNSGVQTLHKKIIKLHGSFQFESIPNHIQIVSIFNKKDLVFRVRTYINNALH